VFNTNYIRVFGGKIGEQNRNEAILEAVDILDQMGDIASDYSVYVLFETHDD